MLYKSDILNKKAKHFLKNIIFSGIDHLEFYLEDFMYLTDDDKQDMTFTGLDDNNSNFGFIDLYGMRLSITCLDLKGYKKGYQFTKVVEDNAVPLFMLRFPQKEKGKVSLVVYSSFLILENYLGFKLYNFLQDNFLIHSLRRVDIAVDITIGINTILGNYFKGVHFDGIMGKDKKNIGFHQTYYIGNLRTDKNRKYVVRIYDKLLDTWNKRKGFLYQHLSGKTNVRRIELELRVDECQRLKLHWLDILKDTDNNIMRIFSNYLNKHWLIELPAGIPLTPYHFEPSDIRTHFDQTGMIPLQYQAQVRGMLKNILINTGYKGLTQVLTSTLYTENLDIRDDNKYKIYQKNTYKDLNLLEAYIKTLLHEGTQKSLVKKILYKLLH